MKTHEDLSHALGVAAVECADAAVMFVFGEIESDEYVRELEDKTVAYVKALKELDDFRNAAEASTAQLELPLK